jgi:hypothetical protein
MDRLAPGRAHHTRDEQQITAPKPGRESATLESSPLGIDYREPRRSTVRTLRLLVALLMGLVWLSLRPPPSALAAGVVGSGTPASCTEAALDAALAGGGMVTFDCGSAQVTITLTQPKRISFETTVDGAGLITLDGKHVIEMFSVAQGGTLSIEKLTIANGTNGGNAAGAIDNLGTLTVTNSTFTHNSGGVGGAIDNGGNLIVTNSTFSSNLGYSAGAIENRGTVTVTNSTFTDNSSADAGAIASSSGTLTVTNSTFSGNSAEEYGGAIRIDFDGGAVTVTNSTFTDNSSGDAGAIWNNGGAVTVTNSTFAGNSGSIYGGAIENYGGTLTVTNSTFSGNSAPTCGAIGNTAFCGDTRDAPCPATLTNTIVANSTQGGNCSGKITDGGHNLDDGTTCGFSAANGSLSSTNPQLAPAGLQSNGGPTQTFALQAGSPAINAGDESVCAAAPVNSLDQRGYVRPGTGAANCSIGAFEYNSSGPPAPTPTLTPVPSVTVTATPTPSQPPTSTPTATGTPTSSATATPTLTATPTPTATRTPTASATPSPSVTATATTQPGGGDEDGCTLTPDHGSAGAWWLPVPALVLAWVRQRRLFNAMKAHA